MPYIISAGTQVTGFGAGGGIESISYSTEVQPNRLYHLGFSSPYDQNVIIQKQLSITCYGGASSVYNTEASTTCDEPTPLVITINASSCGAASFQDTTDWFCTGYSYQKDVQGWGKETWNFTTRPTYLDQNLAPITDVTIRMIRGIAEGQATTDGGADPGIVFLAGSIIDSDTVSAVPFVGRMQVQAGNPGIGRANYERFGVVTQVGQGTGKSDGRDGSGSAQIPYTPIVIVN